MKIESFDFIQYLASKKTVDDRALNRKVLDEMYAFLQRYNKTDSLLNVLEVAAGIGTMLERLIDWQILPNCRYLMLDLSPNYILEAQRRIPEWAQKQDFVIEYKENAVILKKDQRYFEISFVVSDVIDFFENSADKFDLVIAHAFLDFANTESLLPKMFTTIHKGGAFYFSVNFDGETILLPEVDFDLDQKIIHEYHKIMDQQKVKDGFVSGTKTGRNLFQYIQKAGAKILSAGSSDWVVFPQDVAYPHKEDYFLHCIIDTIAETLKEKTKYDIDLWIKKRHGQINEGQLTYIAHQLDFFGICG